MRDVAAAKNGVFYAHCYDPRVLTVDFVRRYALISGFGTALAVFGAYACVTGSQEASSTPEVAQAAPSPAPAVKPEPEPEPEPAPEPWKPDPGADLPDIEGAARALALDDPATAIERIEALGLHAPPEPPPEDAAEPDPGEETRELSEEEKKAKK